MSVMSLSRGGRRYSSRQTFLAPLARWLRCKKLRQQEAQDRISWRINDENQIVLRINCYSAGLDNSRLGSSNDERRRHPSVISNVPYPYETEALAIPRGRQAHNRRVLADLTRRRAASSYVLLDSSTESLFRPGVVTRIRVRSSFALDTNVDFSVMNGKPKWKSPTID